MTKSESFVDLENKIEPEKRYCIRHSKTSTKKIEKDWRCVSGKNLIYQMDNCDLVAISEISSDRKKYFEIYDKDNNVVDHAFECDVIFCKGIVLAPGFAKTFGELLDEYFKTNA